MCVSDPTSARNDQSADDCGGVFTNTLKVARPPAGMLSIVMLSFTEPSIVMNGYITDHIHAFIFVYSLLTERNLVNTRVNTYTK